jgi:protein O-GlcNAc transferase
MQAAWDALERNDFRFAERAAREALARAPQDGEALYLLGSTYLFEGRYADALAPLAQAAQHLKRRGVGYRLGHCHLALGELARAEEALRREARAYPESANAHNTLGVVLVQQGRTTEALGAFRAALRADPAHAEASNNAGNALHALVRDEEALPYLQRAASSQPQFADAHMNLGLVLHALQRYDEAVAAFSRVLELAPGTPYALGAAVWSKLFACDWRELDDQIASLRAQVRELPAAPFTLIAVSEDPEEQRHAAQLHLRQSATPAPLPPPPRYAHEKIRLAYLSADFHQHATAQLMARLFELHDRSRFEVIAVSYGGDDGSAMRQRLVRAFDRFVDARDMPDAEAARMLRQHEVDIAVDLKGHTAHSRMSILASRPAPVQATYLGYPGTTAAPYIDYVLADRVVIPLEHQRFYSEKVIYLPDSYQVNDTTVEIAQSTPSRAELALPDNAFVFCCFNNIFKLLPAMFDVWMRILAARPDSVLWLLEPLPGARRNLIAAARARGIDPGRLVFAPRAALAEHLARQRRADLFLDTVPYNAHTTASDALRAGLPVLTCLGSTFAGRVGASLLHAVGMPELIAPNLAEYERMALELSTEALKEKLARNLPTSALFDSERTCRAIEAAYEEMLRDKLGR